MHVRELMELHNVRPNGLLHVGAHHAEEAEEAEEYIENGLNGQGKITWVEAQSEFAKEIELRLDSKVHKVLCAVAWNVSNVPMTFKITSKSASSSLFDLGLHSKIYPDIKVIETLNVMTVRLDELLDATIGFDMVILDIQGAESQAIDGLGERIKEVKWIFTEISRNELYEGSTLVDDFDRQLAHLGFKRVFTVWDRKAGWGDALYARETIYQVSGLQRIRSTLKRFSRCVRSYIPQKLFPVMVRVKSLLKGLIS